VSQLDTALSKQRYQSTRLQSRASWQDSIGDLKTPKPFNNAVHMTAPPAIPLRMRHFRSPALGKQTSYQNLALFKKHILQFLELDLDMFTPGILPCKKFHVKS